MQGSRLRGRDLDEVVVERRAAADVGHALATSSGSRSRRRRRASPTRSTAPRRRPGGRVGDDGVGGEGAAVVEDRDARAVGDAARVGVVGVDLERRLALGAAQRGDVDERRVEERCAPAARSARAEAPRELGRALSDSYGAMYVGSGSSPSAAIRCESNSNLPARRRNVALGERQIRRRHVQSHPSRARAAPRTSRRRSFGGCRASACAHQRLVVVAKLGMVEAHRARRCGGRSRCSASPRRAARSSGG